MAEISPTKPQYDYITSEYKYPAMVAGLGSGKTEAAVKRSIIGKLRNPGTNRGFYEPTYDLIRMIAFPRFEEALTEMKIPYRLFKSPLNYISIPGYGKIYFRSMDTPSRIIGYEHADADVDELDTLKMDSAADVWRRILARNRQKKSDSRPNTVGLTTTPEGFKFVYQCWEKNPQPGYHIIRAPTYSNPHLPEDYVDSLRDIYPDQLLAAYVEGEFVNLTSGTVYSAYNREQCDTLEEIKPKEPLFIGMDFNVENMSATVHVIRGKAFHRLDDLTKIYDTPAMIEAIKLKYPEHHITIYPDSSGGSRKSVDASVSDISLLRAAGFSVKARPSNPFVKDRVIAMNSALKNGLLKISTKHCRESCECLEQQSYDKNGEPDKKSGHDHLNDSGGYLIAYELPVVKPLSSVKVAFPL